MKTRLLLLFLAFCAGAAFAAALLILAAPGITGMAIAPVSTAGQNNPDRTADNVTYTVPPDFQNNASTILSGRCELNPYTVQRRNYSHLCTLFYNSSVAVRQIGSSGSMWPALQGGGLAILAPVANSSDLAIGDIIVINASIYGQEIAHRIIQLGSDVLGGYFITKGDNNVLADSAHVRIADIIGRVVGVLY